MVQHAALYTLQSGDSPVEIALFPFLCTLANRKRLRLTSYANVSVATAINLAGVLAFGTEVATLVGVTSTVLVLLR